MRHLLKSNPSHRAVRHPVASAVVLSALVGYLSTASAMDLATTYHCDDVRHAITSPAEHPGAGGSRRRLTSTLCDYAGHPVSITLWKTRRPRTASRWEEISNPDIAEMVAFLRGSKTFQEILERLEADRTARYIRAGKQGYVGDPRGKLVRETMIVVWIPKNGGELGVYRQHSGETYAHSDFLKHSIYSSMRTHCDVTLTSEAEFHVRIHTHPMGTVPSMVDLAEALPSLVDMVVSEKGGIPTIFVYTATGPGWELPAALLLPARDLPREADQVVVQR